MENWKILVFFLFGLISTSTAQTDVCANEPDFARIPYPGSCEEYFECIGGRAFRVQCPHGLYFSPHILRCMSYVEANCRIGQVPTAPPSPIPPSELCVGSEDFTMFPSADSCSQYFLCLNETALLTYCPRGTHFTPSIQRCLPYNEANCDIQQPPPQTDICDGVENFGYVPSLDSCSDYYQCIDEVAYLVSCPNGMFFDAERLRCDLEENVDCQLTMEIRKGKLSKNENYRFSTPSYDENVPTVPAFPCQGIEDYRLIASLVNCNEYYQCINGTAFRLRCPEELHFNVLLQSCDDPVSADCILNRPPILPTTTQTPDLNCTDQPDFHRIADPISCDMFYECMDGNSILLNCPRGRYFHEIIGDCVSEEEVDCGSRTRNPSTSTPMPPIQDPQCVGVEEGRSVSNPLSCTSYYECLNGRAYPRFCDDGLWFDEAVQRCDLPENTNCEVTTVPTLPTTTPPETIPTVPTGEPSDLCAGEEDGVVFPSTNYCDSFYLCINETVTAQFCDTGLWFDRVLLECLPIEEVDCDLRTVIPVPTTPDPSPDSICNDAANGTFVGSSWNCAEFFVCINDSPVRRMCPIGLWFNFVQQRCGPATEANCQLDPSFCNGVDEGRLNRLLGACSDYFECVEGNAYAGSCHLTTLMFDEESQRCLPENEVDCENPTSAPSQAPCHEVPDFLLDGSWNDCSEYHVCYNHGILETFTCPEGQVFDFESQDCGEFPCLLQNGQ